MPDDFAFLSWTLRIAEIGKDGRDVHYVATPAERAAIADALDLEALDALAFAGRVKPLSRGRAHVVGRLSAQVVQACVVTLEPVPARIDASVDLEFWPEDDIATQASASFDAMSGDDPEALDGDEIPLGRLAYETLGASLDPYPRQPGAAFADPPDTDPAPRNNPFAALGKLKLNR